MVDDRPTAADAAVWEIGFRANALTREQLALLLDQEDVVQQIRQRFGNLDVGQKSGHVFEWMHELTFNLDAIAKHESVRARVTTWLGQPHAPDDLRILSETGETLRRVQAKVVGNVPQRIGPKNGLADSKYVGMDRLVPSDHVESTDGLLERRLAMPNGPLHQRYEETRSHVTDRISTGRVHSTPVSSEEARAAAQDPGRYLAEHVSNNHLQQVLTTAGAAAAAGTVIAGATAVGQYVIAERSVEGVDWATVAINAAKAGAKQGAIAAAANVISLHVQHQLADGAVGAIEQLAGGTLPFAIARGAFDIAIIAHGVATGRMNGPQAAAAAAESISRTGAVWACAAVGQTLIPVPVVGALVGGVVGQYGAAMIGQGIRIAVAARDLDAEWDVEYSKLVEEISLVEAIASREIEELREFGERYETAFSEYVVPSLERLEASLGTHSPGEVLDELARITRRFGAAPVFGTMSEFDAFMKDESSVLELRLTPRSF